ncbi:hypothetical protein NpPPO83_00011524 [Neofusicoccum parvum]|uniref:Uncharacterized protein n=1 Tax=Neofusicoccum parvum TaxID=310453 RepID=A0ACB5S2C3_9PEZI|nr:hypothetical protein NpPPO83_00011524 [Neofusicoccum parvum]
MSQTTGLVLTSWLAATALLVAAQDGASSTTDEPASSSLTFDGFTYPTATPNVVYVGQFSQAVQLPSTTATPFTTVDGVPVAAVGLGLVLINGCQRDADGHQVCEDLQTALSAWVVGSQTLMASETAALASSVAVSAAATAVVVGTQTVRMPPPAPVTTVAGVPVATKEADLPYSQDCYKESGYQYCRDVRATEFVVEDRTLTPGETTTEQCDGVGDRWVDIKDERGSDQRSNDCGGHKRGGKWLVRLLIP